MNNRQISEIYHEFAIFSEMYHGFLKCTKTAIQCDVSVGLTFKPATKPFYDRAPLGMSALPLFLNS